MTRLGVLHLVDSLDAGGMERVAVNLVNSLPRDRFEPHLGTTRRDGALSKAIAPDVARLSLERRGRFDPMAVVRLARYVRDHDIRVVHAHGSSLFVAAAASPLLGAALVWHDHFGRLGTETRPAWVYRIAARRASGVIAVTRPLVDWAVRQLGVAPERVWYVPNFVLPPGRSPALELPGVAGARIVCLANVRPEKDHGNLVRAMRLVVRQSPDAHLLLVGGATDASHLSAMRRLVSSLDLEKSVSWLGSRDDAAAILAASDIGVLASASEGLPLALLEYGAAGLAAVATDVGECASVLEGGTGLVVPPGDPERLAGALIQLLEAPAERGRMARAFHERYLQNYGPEAGIARVVGVYDAILSGRSALAA